MVKELAEKCQRAAIKNGMIYSAKVSVMVDGKRKAWMKTTEVIPELNYKAASAELINDGTGERKIWAISSRLRGGRYLTFINVDTENCLVLRRESVFDRDSVIPLLRQ